MSTETTISTPQTLTTPEAAVTKSTTEKEPENKSVLTYVFIGVLIISLVLLMYYAYNRFVANSLAEPMTKGTEQERDDPVIDFNLREAIKDLQNIQQRVLNSLSDVSNI